MHFISLHSWLLYSVLTHETEDNYAFSGVTACFGRLMRKLQVENSCEEIC